MNEGISQKPNQSHARGRALLQYDRGSCTAVPFEMFQNSGIVVNMISIQSILYIIESGAGFCPSAIGLSWAIIVYHGL